ncbi:hypothetical protein HXX01_04840 [Candidatus Nomurabacteria bacterium]|nr:hypothetical protein [Candidatus Nomurabacteria bacterium]
MSKHATAPEHDDHSSKENENSKNGSSFWGLLFLIPLITIGLIIFNYLYPSSSDTENKNNSNPKRTEQISETKVRPVEYGPDHEGTIYLNPGYSFHFEDITEPYICTNDNGKSVEGKKGQDRSQQLGGGSANLTLHFTSTSGRNGTINIVLTKTKN